jgi:hypothetical protein
MGRREAATGHRMQAEAARHEEGTGLRTHHGAAIRGRSPLGRAELGPAGHVETTIRVPSGTPVIRSRVAVAGHRSGPDHPGAEAVEKAVGRVLAAGRAVPVADHRVATVRLGATVMRGPLVGLRIVVGNQGDRHGGEAGRADRRAIRLDGLVAARDL